MTTGSIATVYPSSYHAMISGGHVEPLRLQKVTPQRIFEQAVDQIRELIRTGSLSVGQKLPTEQELSKQLNVSRSSVREALRVLESEGLVDVRRGSGTFIAAPPARSQLDQNSAQWLEQREEALEQVLEVRESIEKLAVSLAASRASDAALSDLRGIVEAQSHQIQTMLSSGEDDYDVLSQLDAEFHLAISAASGNDVVHEIIAHLVPAFNESNKAVLYVSRRMLNMENEHRAILQALEKRDPAAAAQAIQNHIASVHQVVARFKGAD